jgi:hypothetical protein
MASCAELRDPGALHEQPETMACMHGVRREGQREFAAGAGATASKRRPVRCAGGVGRSARAGQHAGFCESIRSRLALGDDHPSSVRAAKYPLKLLCST